MPIASVQNPTNQYGINQVTPQAPPVEKTEQSPSATKSDQALTVTISDEAQAMRKLAATQEEERARQRSDSQQVIQQQTEQFQAQPAPGKSGQRLDITV